LAFCRRRYYFHELISKAKQVFNHFSVKLNTRCDVYSVP
jgi:hypothetical protein